MTRAPIYDVPRRRPVDQPIIDEQPAWYMRYTFPLAAVTVACLILFGWWLLNI
jgi:hypothetical protein